MAAECSLPTVPEILTAIYRDRPDRIAEIVAVNEVYLEAIERLDTLHAPSNGQARPDAHQPWWTRSLAGTTIEGLRVHSSGQHGSDTHGDGRIAVESTSPERSSAVGVLVELGTVSRSVTAPSPASPRRMPRGLHCRGTP